MGQRRRGSPLNLSDKRCCWMRASGPPPELPGDSASRNRIHKWQKEAATHGGAFPAPVGKPNPRQNRLSSSESWLRLRRSGTFKEGLWGSQWVSFCTPR